MSRCSVCAGNMLPRHHDALSGRCTPRYCGYQLRWIQTRPLFFSSFWSLFVSFFLGSLPPFVPLSERIQGTASPPGIAGAALDPHRLTVNFSNILFIEFSF